MTVQARTATPTVALNIAHTTDKTDIATCLSRGDCWFGTRRKAMATVSCRW
jgi:iron complex outermembrane recepter protein